MDGGESKFLVQRGLTSQLARLEPLGFFLMGKSSRIGLETTAAWTHEAQELGIPGILIHIYTSAVVSKTLKAPDMTYGR
jgi:hypothetical protein